MRINRPAVCVVPLALLMLAACTFHSDRSAASLTQGDVKRGAEAIDKYGCGSCHTIPGITGANGLVGPALSGIASRTYIAGVLPNEPSNLRRWVQNPLAVNEHTVMPNLGVTPTDASDIAAYLYANK